MPNENTQKEINDLRINLDNQIRNHIHDGNEAVRVEFDDIFNYIESFNVPSATIATTGNTDAYFLAPRSLKVLQIDFSGTTALATSDTNYITWTITNLGQDGTGTSAILGTENTKVTGGSAITADTKRTFTLSSTINDLNVVEGDRIRIRAAVTNTLANTVTFPVYLIQLIQQ